MASATMLPSRLLAPIAAAAAALLAPTASAQGFNNAWLTLSKAPSAINAGTVSSSTIEVDFTPADLDKDGDLDLLVMRKEPFTKPGKRTQMLLMNEGGVLTDRTSTLAVASDFAGDQGFLTPTCTRHCAVADVDNDGWPDVITATALGDTDPKYISHPRVYRNLGKSGDTWLGLRHEQSRIPQLPGVPRFVRVLAGDVNGDGAVDLYFVDHDDGVGGYHQPAGTDLDDRLLMNTGAGYFVDESSLHLTSSMLGSTFGTSGALVDINQDGVLDVVKNDTNGPANPVSVAYNSPANKGTFNIFQEFDPSAAYFIDVADLNGDGRLDVVSGDDSNDRFLFNTGNDSLGRVMWSPQKYFTFLAGSDDGFTGQIHIADLNNDGWNDVWICDQDVDVPSGSGHRSHLYHNAGGAVGSTSISLIEERKSSSNTAGNWVGAVGLETTDLNDTWDSAIFDYDNDGDLDVVVGRSAGTMVWRNTLDPVCQTNLGFSGPGVSTLKVCGNGLGSGQTSTLALSGAPASAPVFLAAGLAANPTPAFGGTVVPLPVLALIGPFLTDAHGDFALPGVPGGGGPYSVYVQALVVDHTQAQDVGLSNALELQFQP